MRLSILIPVYNVASYLPDLLKKLLPNLPNDVEIIFYDDATPDNSITIIKEYLSHYGSQQIQILRGSENVGLTKARDRLLKASKAEYIWFIDSDDIVEEFALTEIISILSQAKPDVLMFDYNVFFDENNKVKHRNTLSFNPKNKLVKTSGKKIYRTAILDGKHYFWNKIFRRTLIEDAVCYDISAFEDIAYTPILLSKCQSFYYYSRVVVHYRIRSNSIAQKISSMQLYGIKAYIQQADYAELKLDDHKSRAYLLYKACIYFYRMCHRICKSNLPFNEKVSLTKLSQILYREKKISEWQIVSLLIKEAMFTKAVKLSFYILYFRIIHTVK